MPDGRLRFDAFITKPGVFEYADPTYPGGIRRELRDDREVYSQRTMESFAQVPVTHGHPPTMLNAENAKYHMVGSTGDQVQRLSPGVGEPDHLATSGMVADRATIDAMESGDTEVSCGYGCAIDETPGTHPVYGKYDCVQSNIIGNHLAVAVGRGRAGRTARARMDAELTADERNKLRDSQFAVPSTGQLPINDEAHTRAAMSRYNQTDFPSAAAKKTAYDKICAAAKKFGIDSTDFEKKYGGDDRADSHQRGASMADEKKNETTTTTTAPAGDMSIAVLGHKLRDAETRADAADRARDEAVTARQHAEGKVKTLEEQIVDLRTQVSARVDATETAAITAMRERAQTAEAAVSHFDSRFDAAVKQRVLIVAKAQAYLGPKFRFDDMSERQIMAAVVSKLNPKADVSAKVPDGEIKGRFDAETEREDGYAQSLARSAEVLAANVTEKPRTDAKSQSQETLRNLWKQPLPNDIRAAHIAGGK
jgi:hypothetical protein